MPQPETWKKLRRKFQRHKNNRLNRGKGKSECGSAGERREKLGSKLSAAKNYSDYANFAFFNPSTISTPHFIWLRFRILRFKGFDLVFNF